MHRDWDLEAHRCADEQRWYIAIVISHTIDLKRLLPRSHCRWSRWNASCCPIAIPFLSL